MPIELRDYQSRGLQLARQKMAGGSRRLIFVSPTGSGKTVMAAFLIESHLQRNPENRVVFLASGIELIEQSSETLWNMGIDNGIIMAGYEPIPEYRVQVASKDTLFSRTIRNQRIEPPKATLVIVDECHGSITKSWLKCFDLFPDAWFVGLSATPIRGDGVSLSAFYDDIVEIVTYQELLDNGHLVPVRVFAPSEPDLKNIKTSRITKDFDPVELEAAMNQPKLVGDVYTHWTQYASDRLTVVYASGIKHSIALCEEFNANGVTAAHIDGTTDNKVRLETLKRFESGEIRVVCNYGCLIQGWDCPPCSCIILCQPTKSLGRFRQMAGRILRPAQGKTDALILDHAGAVHRHGWPTDDVEWTLEPECNIQERHEQKRKSKPSREPYVCPQCKLVRQGGRECRNCGYVRPVEGKSVKSTDGQLLEMDKTKAKKPKPKKLDKQKAWDDFVGVCIQKGWPIKRAAGMYKARFGVWPRGLERMPRGSEQFQMNARRWYQEYVCSTA